MKLIQKGSIGLDVKKWQRFLNDNGYNCGKVDGQFGGKTQAQTMLFQEANGLVDDGIVGKLTVKKAEEFGFEKQTEYLRDVNELILHITATAEGTTVADIEKMHLDKGYSYIGYHWLIDEEGEAHEGRDESIIGAHVAGYNVGTIGLAYIARGDDHVSNAKFGEYMTDKQKAGLIKKAKELMAKYNLKVSDVSGHNNYNKGKACPCFQVKKATELLEQLAA